MKRTELTRQCGFRLPVELWRGVERLAVKFAKERGAARPTTTDVVTQLLAEGLTRHGEAGGR